MVSSSNVNVPGPGDLIFLHETSVWDKIIQLRTRGNFNHVEIVLNATYSIGARWDGVRVHQIPHPLYPYPLARKPRGGYTVLVHTPVNKDDHDSAVSWVESQRGKKYDWLDILLNAYSVLRPHGPFPDTPQAWTCSELAATYLVKAGNPYQLSSNADDLRIISPNDLYRAVLKGNTDYAVATG